MKIRNFQKQVKEESSLKQEQNELAIVLAQRDDDCILYEDNNPLVISDDCKITKIEVKEEYETMNEKDVKIEFQDNGEEGALDKYKSEKTPFTMDIHTFLPLEKFEEVLSKCNNLSDIEDLEDSH